MKPTITAVLPGKGHTGGQTLIEIRGTGFTLTPDPPDVIPAPEMPPRVLVLFGGIPATEVGVIDDGTLYCVTPIHDAGLVDVTVQNLDETPAELVSGVEPFAISPGDTLGMAVNGFTGTLIFGGGDIAVPGAATALEFAAFLNALAAVQALAVNGHVEVRTDRRGPNALLSVMGGSAAGPIAFFPSTSSGTTDLIPVDGDVVVAPAAFEFARPDLTVKGPITIAIEQLQVELRRQVIDNVNFATHSDFDADTGDMLNTTFLAKLPGIVLADLQLPDTTLPVSRIPQEVDGEDGKTMIVEADDLVDIVLTAVVVTDDPRELFNLMAIMRRFVRKNAEFMVPIDLNDATKGTNEYPLVWEQGTPINIAAQRGGENLHSFTGQFSIRGVATGDMPIAYSGAMPEGAPVGARYEGVSAIAFPRTAAPDVGVGSSDD